MALIACEEGGAQVLSIGMPESNPKAAPTSLAAIPSSLPLYRCIRRSSTRGSMPTTRQPMTTATAAARAPSA